ncbi:helix-turn-helix domain-containing protein [Gorillibacterium sp. sgz5001074]|uniref:helix-turn-helix domain-containing protein n=1 Tax=Gorillibacterium sp. sgz5001074 TaxID=3446695 RepID=UPI003F668051
MIQLISCGHHYIHDDGIDMNRPNGSGNFAFVFFKSRSELELHGKSGAVEKNTYVLISPDTPHRYRHLDKPFINDWFHCEGRGLEEFLAEIGFPLNTPVHAEDPFMISRAILDLNHLSRQTSPLKSRVADCDLQSLFMRLAMLRNQTAVHETSSRYFLSFSRLRNDLYSSPNAAYTVEKLASSVNMSKSYFQHIYKELFGCSVITDLIHARLEYAKYLLNSTALPVTVISRMCGYENDTHFMRQFKKFLGVTPSQYKAGAAAKSGLS